MRRLLSSSVLALVLLCAAAATPALGAFGFKALDVTFEEEDGTAATRAGSHPFAMTTTVGVNTATTPEGEVPEGELRNLTASQITGFVGSQTAVPTCEVADFNNRVEGRPSCPDSTAVGYAGAEVEFKAFPPGQVGQMFHVPVYNLTPPPGVPAELGFVVLNVPVTINVTVSESPPYNLIAKLNNVPQAILFYSSELTLWGNPASPAHDALRGNCLGEVGYTSTEPVSLGICEVSPPEEEAFLTLPRACEGPLSTVFSALSWMDESDAAEPPTALEMTGCDELEFEPRISAQPSNSQAESPAGLSFNLDFEDEGITDPAGRAQSDLKKVVATLPEGMTLNPSAAEGLAACSLAQYEAESLHSSAAQGCPESSTLGSAEIASPLLADPLHGRLYLAEQDNNPFKSTFALYLVIKSAKYGILVKQAGKVEADPQSGQLTSTFEEIPQLPFAHLELSIQGGPRAPLVTPAGCGAHTAQAVLTPWADPGAPLTETASFQIGSGTGGGPCPSGPPAFAPALTAGSASNEAGTYSPFYMRITRSDAEQEITRLDSVLPPGLLGKIAGVGKCPDAAIEAARAKSGRAEQAAPSCPASSRVGRVLAGAGVGSALTWVPGTIYLAGPFAGNPLSIVVITPALAGPFDLGNVVIREGLRLNPITADVEVDGSSAPIPRILEGVPLRLRDLRVYVDRPDFTLNPTNCNPLATQGTLLGSLGSLAPLSAPYQAANCGRLAFNPKLALKLKGGTRRNDHPSLRSVLTPRPGDANIGRAVVTLPPSEFIDNAHIQNPCTRVQFNANACPKGSILGHATAYSPLLDEPLEGPVYFRSNGGERLLPDIVADLHGQFHFTLVGFVDSKNARIRTTFATVPDAPVSKFELSLNGGKKGLLVNNRDLCAHKLRAKLSFTAQNGAPLASQPVVGTSCGRKASGGKQSKK
jgi:hypothetical protein